LPINPLKSFGPEEDGAVAVIVALLLVVLLGFAALGVDVASLYRERAALQSLSDLTAMSATAQTDTARARALTTIARNGEAPEALQTLQTGRFLRNPAIASGERFTELPEGSAGINTVRLVLSEDAPLHFAKIFSEKTHVNLTRTATASRTGAASFSLDSNLANIDNATLNGVIAQRFGVNATIDLGDLSVLSEVSVDLAAVLAALDVDTGRNPAEVLDAVTSGADLVAALQSVLPPSLAGALIGLRTAAGNTSVPVSSLIGGIDTDLGLTATDFLSGVNISALDVIKSLVASQTGAQKLTLNAGVAVSGVLSTTTNLTAGEPAAQSRLIALGEEGVQLHRAAVRLESLAQIEPSLLGSFATGLEIASVTLPLYAELAGSTATLEEIGCSLPSPLATAARFRAAPTPLNPANGTSVAALYLGRLPATAGLIDPASLEFADVLDINISIKPLLLPSINISGLTIQARSHVAVGRSQTETITFTQADITNEDTVRSFGSGELVSPAIMDLLSPANTELRVKPGQEGLVAGAAAPLMATLLQLLPGRLLSGLAAPLDGMLDATLAGAGLELGAGELTLTGHHCETVRLVR